MLHWPKAPVVLVGKWLEMETWIYGAPGIYGNTVTNVKNNIRTKVEVCKHTLNFIKPIIQRIIFNMHHTVPIFPTYTVNKPRPTSKQMLFPFQTHHVQIPGICFQGSHHMPLNSLCRKSPIFSNRDLGFLATNWLAPKRLYFWRWEHLSLPAFHIAYKANRGFLRDIQAIASEKVC